MGWEKKLLGDVLELKRGYDLPKNNRESGDVQVISSSGPSGYHSSAKVPGPGVVTGRYGTIGEVFYSNDDFWPLNTSLYVRDFKGNDPKFIYYFLKTLNWQQFNDKSGVPGVNRNHVHEAEIVYPNTLAEQKNVASILSALDDKIELNRQMNETLEEMARSTFKSWFVDFDPVVAKAAGQSPAHMSADTAALFPAAFNEEGLPDGWRLGQLDDVLVLQRGFDLPVKKRIEGNHPVFAAGGFHGTHEEAKVRAPGVVTGRSGVIGNVFLVQDDFWPLNTTLWVKEFKLGSAYYSYQLLKTINLAAFNAGSAVPSLNRNHIHNYSVCLPDEKVIAAYEEIASAFFQKIKANNEQNQTLADLRDTLLPKLMTGEIRLRDVEKAVEDA